MTQLRCNRAGIYKEEEQGEMLFHVIGLADRVLVDVSPELRELIARSRVFSGGVRHHELVRHLLPADYQWIAIVPPMECVFEQYEEADEVVVFTSGDPLFYGFAATIQRLRPEASLKIYPSFNSLQMLAHRLQMPYEKMHVVSLTGRPWAQFDEALIRGEACIGILTDRREHSPARIAQRMLDYGYDNYEMTIGELLGNEQEKFSQIPLQEVAQSDYAYPNNLILTRKYKRPRPFGIADESLMLLDGRSKMLTKRPIRLASLAFLNLREAKVFWDVGFCTGSISIEAKLQFPHLQVVSFEKREACREIYAHNTRQFGTLGMECVIGDFYETKLDQYPAPDAIFIGGHGGRLPEMLRLCLARLRTGGSLVFNSVSEESRSAFLCTIQELGLDLVEQMTLRVDSFNSITILKTQQQ